VARSRASLYDDVQRRLARAAELIGDLDASEEVKVGLVERLERYRWGSKSDLTRTSRRLDDFLEELRAGILVAAE
jgi:hypothetical protein